MMFRILLLLVLVNLPLSASANTILIVGDSLSAAYGMPLEQGWVRLLQQRLAADDYPYTIVNASISGDTTANALNRLPQAMTRHQPVIVVLELGGNDGLRGLSLAAMKRNLAAMIQTARQHEAEVLLIGVQLPPNYGPRYTQQFHAVYHELAQEYGLALLPSLVDGVGTRTELMQADGIHPNSKAQPLIVTRVWQQLRPLIDAQKNEAH
ncbi:MAG: arylesterase [Pseudomonadota bacterium]|nr:arylesterase [Pseudomonadota bacterium]